MNKLSISVSKQPNKKAALNVKQLTIRERILRNLLGPTRKVMILVPGEQLGEIIITKEEGEKS